ncbi:DUF2052 domain-containing protein [Aphelenchoides fujianensis]|nr:DUF2052 domain-containing protein [Aphelenchoides fujianensis]
MDVHDLDSASASDANKDRLIDSLLEQKDLFICSQQRGEDELEADEKRRILKELLEQKPAVFLQRYHDHIPPEFLDCFPLSERCEPFIRLIRERPPKRKDRDFAVRNRRFLAMQKLKEGGDYFSLSKMRERAPMHFDLMVGNHLLDSEKLHLRPTVEPRAGSAFSNLMEQFDESQRISDRRKRHFEQYESFMKTDSTDRFLSHVSRQTEIDDQEFEMEFNSDDSEGRAAEAKRKRTQTLSRYTVDKEVPPQHLLNGVQTALADAEVDEQTARQMSELTVDEPEPAEVEESPEPPSELPHDDLMAEFQSFMERRFLSGEDEHFVDYARIDSEETAEMAKWRQQDDEDAYFADLDE